MEAGSPLLLRTSYGTVELRALHSALLAGDDWELVVRPRQPTLHVTRGRLEVPQGEGTWQTEAELVRLAGGHRLRPAAPAAPVAEQNQRRAHTRAELALLFCAELLRDDDGGRAASALRQVRGHTTNVSAGGAAVEFTIGVELDRDDRLLMELQIPGGQLIDALAVVIAADPGRARLRFAGIEGPDADRLESLVTAAVRRRVGTRRL